MRTTEHVTHVIDRDTFTTSGHGANVRLERVNAPETGQPGYQEAKDELARLILHRTVTVETKAHDTYGRRVAQVWRQPDGMDVNNAMRAHLGQGVGRSFGFRGY